MLEKLNRTPLADVDELDNAPKDIICYLRDRLTTAESIVATLTSAIIGADDYLDHFEMENDINKPEFLYIRDAMKCLRSTDCV